MAYIILPVSRFKFEFLKNKLFYYIFINKIFFIKFIKNIAIDVAN